MSEKILGAFFGPVDPFEFVGKSPLDPKNKFTKTVVL